MASSSQAFNQVKNILGKLDRSIDQARARRLGDPEPSREPAHNPTQDHGANSDQDAPNQKRYGRARPIRPSGDSAFRF